MPKIRKVKRRKTYKVNVNRKRLRNKLRKLPDIGCKDIKAAWDKTKSTRHNLGDMGLALDPNEVLKIPNSKRELLQEVKQKKIGNSLESDEESEIKVVPPKIHVAATLEAEAKARRDRLFRLPNQQVQFVTYLMDKYADDYKAMARDKKNYYQMTWRQIRAKINTFKGIPEQYAEYLLKKGDIVLDDPTPLEETRKKIAEENVKKFCAPKPKKAKPVKSKWQEESEEEMDFDAGDKLEDLSDGAAGKIDDANGEPVKKLQLFSDDENDEQDDGKSKSRSKKSKGQLEGEKNGKSTKRSAENDVPATKIKETVTRSSKKAKVLEISPSSDSECDEDLEGDDDDASGFVDLNELTDEELSEDDILDNGEFVTDSDESD